VTEGFTNIAKVEGYYYSTRVNDQDSSTVQIARIDLRKQAEGPDSRVFASGSDVTFEIFVQNTGEVALSDVVVTDALAPGCAKSIGPLDVGASTTYTCTVPGVTQGFTNTATVEGYWCTTRVTDQDPSTVEIAQIDLRKQAEGPDARDISYGSDVSFEIFVENTGEVALDNVEVTDAMVPGCSQYIGTLAAGGTYTYSCVAQDVTEDFTNTAQVTGVVGTVEVWDEDPSTVHIRLYHYYFPVIGSYPPMTKYNLSLGYEDLRLDQANDFDYNDWIVNIITNLTYSTLDQQTVNLTKIAFTITPQARGALLNHEYRLKFDPNTFSSDGVATIVVRDGLGNVISSTPFPFIHTQVNDFLIFDCTCNALPGRGSMNTVEGVGPVPTQRTAEFSLQFNSETPFVLADFGMHGEGLFFNPYLRVTGLGGVIYDVGINDIRTLVAPVPTWKWPEEGVRIDQAYPAVSFIGPPTMFVFSSNWWQTFNTCVYGDGVVCVLPSP
jgi:uncharacterized repeat protein (TIGR01451 family)